MEELKVPNYLVERYLPSGGSLHFRSVSQRVRPSADESRTEETAVPHLWSPFCLTFTRVGLRVERISEAGLCTGHAALRHHVQAVEL